MLSVDEDVEVAQQIVEQLAALAVEELAVLGAARAQLGRRRRCLRWEGEGGGMGCAGSSGC